MATTTITIRVSTIGIWRIIKCSLLLILLLSLFINLYNLSRAVLCCNRYLQSITTKVITASQEISRQSTASTDGEIFQLFLLIRERENFVVIVGSSLIESSRIMCNTNCVFACLWLAQFQGSSFVWTPLWVTYETLQMAFCLDERLEFIIKLKCQLASTVSIKQVFIHTHTYTREHASTRT